MTTPTFRHEAMTTHFEIAVADQAPDYARRAAAAAFRELDRLEGELSRFIESSDIARANGLARGATIVIGDDTLQCLLAAIDVCVATNGAFDPAYASVRAPDDDPGAPPFTLDPEAHALTSRVSHLHLDLGAVGKGYALDRLAAILREWEIAAACLNAGDSTVLALAPPPDAAGWPVGLGTGAAHRIFPLADASLSASGTAVKGAHLVDPATGRAAGRGGRVWALAASAAVSDALSTAFFVMDDEAIAQFCRRQPAVGAAVEITAGALSLHGALRTRLASAP